MGIRDTLNKNKPLASGVIIVVVGLVCYLLVSSGERVDPSGDTPLPGLFYTSDLGETYGSDSRLLTPPFEKDGKTYHRAFLFTCDDGATKFVGYMEKYSPEAKARLDGAKSQTERLEMERGVQAKDKFVAKAKTSNWVSHADPNFPSVVKVSCPNGKRASAIID